MSWLMFILSLIHFIVVVLIPRCSGFSQGSAIVNNFESSYCESDLDDLQRGPLHYDMVSCGGVCRARVAPINLYALRPNSTEYSANNNVTLTLRANSRLGANILGFVIVAIAESGMTAGRWMVDLNDDDPEVLRATCDSLLEGQVIFHAKSSSSRTNVEVVWNPRSTNYGRIIFRAWVVQSHDTIYTVDSEPLINPLDGAETMSMERRFASIIGNIISNRETTAASNLNQQETNSQRDIQASSLRRVEPNNNTTVENPMGSNINPPQTVVTTPAAAPQLSSSSRRTSSSSNSPSFIPQFQHASPTVVDYFDNNTMDTNSTTRKRLPGNIIRTMRNGITAARHKLAIPARMFRSNGTITSSAFPLPGEPPIGNGNSSTPLLSKPPALSTTLDDDQANVNHSRQMNALPNTDIIGTDAPNTPKRISSPIPQTGRGKVSLLQTVSSPSPSFLERFEESFQNRLTSGYNLTLDDPFSNFNAPSYSLNDFFPPESLTELLNTMSERALLNRKNTSHGSSDNSGHNSNNELPSQSKENTTTDTTRELQSQSDENEGPIRPIVRRVITPAGNSGPQAETVVQPPSNSNPSRWGSGANNQFLQQPGFQNQLQWQQQQQQPNQGNFNYLSVPWMNPMRNIQNLPSFQNTPTFQQGQPQANQWLVNDNQPFFTFSPNRQNMAAHANNFIGRFPNADQLLGRTNNNFQPMPNLNNNNNNNNNNNFLQNGWSNQPFNNQNGNDAGNLALQNQVRMFLANRNQAMRGGSSNIIPRTMPPQNSMPQQTSPRWTPPATNGNSNNNNGISFNWFG